MAELDIVTILASEGVHFLLSCEGKVPLSSLNGKTICLYFSSDWCRPCKSFTPKLSKFYNALIKTEKNLEIIFVSFDRNEDGFNEEYKRMPWLALPFDLGLQKRLSGRFKVVQIPSFIPMSCVDDGESIVDDCIGFIEDYGEESFPFTKKRKEELMAMDMARLERGKLEHLLGNGYQNFLIERNDRKILVSGLFGKTIGLFFGAHWCPPSRTFTKQLIDIYNEIRTNQNQNFEIIFVSTDRDHEEFNLNLSTMPWWAISYEEKTRQNLCRIFNIKEIPTLVLIGEDGKIITTNGRQLVLRYGAKSFPFTESRISRIEEELAKEGDELPQQVSDIKHVHELKLEMAKRYVCDSCKMQGVFWTFTCHVCDYDLHPKCLEENTLN